MNSLLLVLAITAAVSSPIFSKPTTLQQRGAREKAAPVKIIKGPEIESATDRLAIIRWTTKSGWGSVQQYGVVQYGTDRKNLSQMAKSPNRSNKSVPYMIYRVRVDGLKPRTTYYYTVDAMQGDGARAGLKSTVKQFTTRERP